MNAASFCVSHPAKFNSRIINAFRTRATRVHAYVPPCQHYPRHKRKTPWHPLAQSRATAGNLKQLRVRCAYVRCSSCKTRGNVRSFNENSLNLSENLYIYIYTLYLFLFLLSRKRIREINRHSRRESTMLVLSGNSLMFTLNFFLFLLLL